jgi:hypothetical protein
LSLFEELDREAPKWAHEAGDTLGGILRDIDTFYSDKGYDPSPMIVVEVNAEVAGGASTENGGEVIADGEFRTFYASATVSRNEWNKLVGQGISVGDPIAVKYGGMVSNGGSSYHSYKLRGRPSGNGENGTVETTDENGAPMFPAEPETVSAQTDEIPY